MLSDLEVEQLFCDLGLTEEGRQLVRDVRENSPAREVGSNLGNSCVDHYSRKMGNRHLRVESRTVESIAAVLHEDDEEVLEYWPQTCWVDLNIVDVDGKNISRTQHCPDFMVVRRRGITFEEWREESRLMRLRGEGNQFYKNEQGWHYRSAEAHFENLGLIHKVRSALELPKIFVENNKFLEDYKRIDTPPLSEEVEKKIIEVVSSESSVPFLDLLHSYSFQADDIFKAIIKMKIYVDLYSDRLSEPGELLIHRNKAIAKINSVIGGDNSRALPIPGMSTLSAGAKITFDGILYEVVLVGGGEVLLRNNEKKTISLPVDVVADLFSSNDIEINSNSELQPKYSPLKSLADYSNDQIEEAERRLNLIKNGNYGSVSGRTIKRWESKIDNSMSEIEKLLALISGDSNRGNRKARLPASAEALAEEIIRTEYNTPDCQTGKGAYGIYLERCGNDNVSPMSYATFMQRINGLGSTQMREGKRKAYQDTSIPLHLNYGAPVHGVKPYDVCYIDHTILDLATVGPGGSALGKPTFTLGVDGNTTNPKALYVSYDPPSANVVLMTLRDYVRRNNRCPKTLIVDGGAEFRSKYLLDFCARYGIDLRHRASGRPRGGTLIERAIGASGDEILAGIKGNTRIMKNARMVTKSVNPFPRAEWTLPAIHGALEEYLFEIRAKRIHPAFGMSPCDYEKMKMEETGYREHTLVKFDENLMLMTSPHTKRKYHKVDPIRGVWADNTYYWHDELKNAQKGEQVEVRIEPWNAIVVYVYFRNHWIAAISRELRRFSSNTKREFEIAFRAERKKAKTASNKERLSKDETKKLLKLMSPENFDSRIKEQQHEMKHLYSNLGMTTAMPLDMVAKEVGFGAKAQVDNFEDSEKPNSESMNGLNCNNEEDEELWEGIDGYF